MEMAVLLYAIVEEGWKVFFVVPKVVGPVLNDGFCAEEVVWVPAIYLERKSLKFEPDVAACVCAGL